MRYSLRPFVDTSVLLAAFCDAGCPSSELLVQQTRGELAIVISRQVLEELVTTVRVLMPEVLPNLQAFMLSAAPEICPDPEDGEVRRLAACMGLEDAPILAAAIQCRADCLVTTDVRQLAPEVARCARFPVLAPSIRLAEFSSAASTSAGSRRGGD